MKTLYRSSSSADSLIHRPYTLYLLKFLLLCPTYKDPISSYEAFHEYSVSNLEVITFFILLIWDISCCMIKLINNLPPCVLLFPKYNSLIFFFTDELGHTTQFEIFI
ncbi:hypothetical protein Hanom_Chr07g00605141 [Helianthus anomalus]